MWWQLLLVLQVGITCVTGTHDVSINHGALVENKGQVKMIENVVIIKKNLTELRNCQSNALEMINIVKGLLKNEKESENKELLLDAKDKLMEITGSRKKRSLLPFVGSIMNSLFGVATESSLEREKERLDKIETWAQEYGHVINNVISNLNDHAESFNKLSDELLDLENKVEDEINKIERKLKIQNVVNKINLKINKIMNIMESVRLAHFGKVDVNLITVAELKEIISYSIFNFNFQPLDVDIVTYYSMLTVKVVDNMCYILLPFNNDDNLFMKRIIPFPMTINDKEIMLSGGNRIVLGNKMNDLINVWKEKDLENCLEWREKNYICNNPNFYLQPIDRHECIKFLLQGGVDNCIYQYVEKDFHVFFLKNVYIFTKEMQVAELSCKGKETKLDIINVKILPGNCKIKIPGYFYYKPTIFKNVDLNVTEKSFNIDNTLKKFEINHNQIKMKTLPPYESKIMILYKQSVMPWITILTLPVLIIIIFLFYCGVRVMVLKRIDFIKSLLNNVIDEEKK